MVPLNSTVLEVLKTLKETSTSEYVFPYQSIGSSFRRASRRANLPGVTPHTLRHTFASRLVMSGVDLRTVQELGGWRKLARVERYSHLSPQHKARAIERLAEFPFTHAGAVEKAKFGEGITAVSGSLGTPLVDCDTIL